MSRHVFDSGEQRWTVGWDIGLSTFYAQVEELPSPASIAAGESSGKGFGADFEDDSLRDVVGLRRGELGSVAQLRTALAPHVELPAAVAERLALETHAAAGPVASAVAMAGSSVGPRDDLGANLEAIAAAFPATASSASRAIALAGSSSTSTTLEAPAVATRSTDAAVVTEGLNR